MHDVVEPRLELIAQIRERLQGVLGAHVVTDSPLSRANPVKAGFVAALGFGLLFGGLEWWLSAPDYLLLLTFWGTAYLGVVVALTRGTDRALQEALPSLIQRHYSPDAARTACVDLSTRVNRRQIVLTSTLVTVVTLALSLLILRHAPFGALTVLLLGYAYLYWSASAVTLTTRFHLSLSKSIRSHPSQLFRPDPARSPIILGTLPIGIRILRYWVSVFVLVLSLYALPFALRQWHPNASPNELWTFVFAATVVAGFFSFVFGTLNYFHFADDLRGAADEVRLESLAAAQAEYQRMSGDGTHEALSRVERSIKRLSKAGLHETAGEKLTTGALAYLPLVTGLIAALLKILGYGDTPGL